VRAGGVTFHADAKELRLDRIQVGGSKSLNSNTGGGTFIGTPSIFLGKISGIKKISIIFWVTQ
jgi:hypothetical protein